MKAFERALLIVLLVGSAASLFVASGAFLYSAPSYNKWISTGGLLASLAGFIQLDISGFFQRVVRETADDEKHPYGPPSRITREIIYDPDAPVRMDISGKIYFDPKTGFWLIVTGTVLQLFALWL